MPDTKPVGAWLARDEGASVTDQNPLFFNT